MKNLFINLLAVSLFMLFAGCDKNSNDLNENGKVELYLLENYSRIGHSYQIDEETVVTKKDPLIYYSDFLSYNPENFTFELSERAVAIMKDRDNALHGSAFALKANNELIYTGYFWFSYSSASCDWTVIDPLRAIIGNKIRVELGYPGIMPGQQVNDKRNDKRIVKIFSQDGKLK